ncbi:Protein quaking [Strongyloides ratti]|uniref:Protein quaking n=1 Tax=Strongyloides ratti TaxID=34506 RepID=A0A090LAN5_STRRB|nr:Protein quaking [Strongyloides ratti]CEF66851.1 Protein quaking [Strongyloides ratti]
MEAHPPFDIIGLEDDRNHQRNLDNFVLSPTKLVTSFDSEINLAAFGRNNNTRNVTLDYMVALLKERKQLVVFREHFPNVINLLDEEVSRVRMSLFQCDFSNASLELPEPRGNVVLAQKKVYVPVDKYPDFNFVGRILGPRGMTAKQLEQETDCKIMVRGKGSLRDKKKEETFRGKPNWEHLDDELHVLIQCEDTQNRAEVKISNAVNQVDKLLVPAPEGSDELKRKQLMELAIINGTYRSATGSKYPASGLKPTPLSLNINNSLSGKGDESLSRSMSCGYYPTSPIFPQTIYGLPQPMSAGFTDKGFFSSPLSPYDMTVPSFDALLNNVDFTKLKLLSSGTPSSTSDVFTFPSNLMSPNAINDTSKRVTSPNNKYKCRETHKSTLKPGNTLSPSC